MGREGARTAAQHLSQLAAWLSPRRNVVGSLSIDFNTGGSLFTAAGAAALNNLFDSVAGSTSITFMSLAGDTLPSEGGAARELGAARIQLPRLEELEYNFTGVPLAGSLAQLTALTRLEVLEAGLFAQLPPSLVYLRVSSWWEAEFDPYKGILLTAVPGPLPRLEFLSIHAWLAEVEDWEGFVPLGIAALGGLTALRFLEIIGVPGSNPGPAGFLLQGETPDADPLAGLSALSRLEYLHLHGVNSMGDNQALNLNSLQCLTASVLLTMLLLHGVFCLYARTLSKRVGAMLLADKVALRRCACMQRVYIEECTLAGLGHCFKGLSELKVR